MTKQQEGAVRGSCQRHSPFTFASGRQLLPRQTYFQSVFQHLFAELSDAFLKTFSFELDNNNFCNVHKQERLHLDLFRGSNDTQS